MFDLGWTEMLVIAIVLIVVVGPKDLPRMLRSFGRTTAKMRAMAGDFRRQFDEALKEAELDDVKNLASDMRKLNPAADLKKALNPMQKAAEDVRAGLDAAMKPTRTPETAPTTAAEPAKAGAAAVPEDVATAEAATRANGHDAAAPAPAAKAAKTAAENAKPAKPAAPKKKAPTKTGSKA
jgi:sec-independent protein translocase protein TatB